MNVNYSLRSALVGIVFGLILLAYGIAYYSTTIYHELAIDNHKTSLENLIGFQTEQLLENLQETQKIFGYKLLKEAKFKKALKTKNYNNLEASLAQNFRRYFVTAGLLDLVTLQVSDTSHTILAASSTIDQGKNSRCPSIEAAIKISSGPDRLKPKYALCQINDQFFSEVLVPIGNFKIKGHLLIRADITVELTKLEKELQIPIRLRTASDEETYRSSNWPSQNSPSNILLRYTIKDHYGNPGILINGLYDSQNFISQLNNRRSKLFVLTTIIAWVCLLSVLFILATVLRPLERLTKSSGLLLTGEYSPIVGKNLPSELVQPVHAFNQMLAGLESEENKRHQAEQQLCEEKDFSNTTLNSINNAVVVIGMDGYIQFVNPAAETILSANKSELIGNRLADKITFFTDRAGQHPANYNMLFQAIDDAYTKKTLFIFDPQQALAEVEFSHSLMHRDNKESAHVLIFRDVTEDRALKRQLSFDAYHDKLTGLFNRLAFEEKYEALIRDGALNTPEHVIVYMDLDQFKVVNDTCGHAAGDLLLQKLTAHFKALIRKADIVARLGGDEFGIILPYCSLEKATEILSSIIKEVVDYRFVWNERVFTIGISMGVTQFGLKDDQLNDQMSAIDAACYFAKKHGGNRFHLYQSDDAEILDHKNAMDWVAGIHKGLSENRFVLYAQPIHPLSSKDRTTHYEILIRYMNEDGKIILPGEFLPAAERYNLIEKIDLFVTSSVIGWLEEYQDIHPEILFSINLSGRSLGSKKFQETLEKMIRTSSIDTRSLCFEITETAIISDVFRSIEFINAIKALGAKFSLDDFGSGLSSFAYLKQFPVDFLKIDGMFVKEMIANPEDYVFVRAMTEVGHCLGMRVIAEFVESKKMYHLLREANVDYAQGWAVGKPKPLASLIDEKEIETA